MQDTEQIGQLAEEFDNCRKILLALGDETRQHLIFEMLKMGSATVCGGKIMEKTNLSRPALVPSPGAFEGCWACEDAPGGRQKLLLLRC